MDESKRKSVLIVDDEKSNIIVLTNILSADYKIFALKDSSEALRVAEENMPDVILLDIIMPEMDGYDVIAALKASKKAKDIPVIFITGLNNTEAEERGLTLGAVDFIPKPFSPMVVKLRVENQIKLAAKERLEYLNRVRSEFLSRMSHEMFNPMNVIIGMTQVIKMLPVANEIKGHVDEIDNASSSLMKMINELLDISNIGQ